MRVAPSPKLQLFVCANRREGSPLGDGCGARGDALYDALKAEVAARGEIAEVWVARTHCLGICPKVGATVARWPSRAPIRADVLPSDVDALLADEGEADGLLGEIEALEALERDKVLALARRLKPGLTLEDIQNPHDFPELGDPDWHYADGVLTGVQAAASVVRAFLARARVRGRRSRGEP